MRPKSVISGVLFVGTILVSVSPASAVEGTWILPAKPLPGKPTPQAKGLGVAVGPGRTATAIWVDRPAKGTSEGSDDDWRLRATTRPAAGKFGRPVTLLTVPAFNNRIEEPKVVAGSSGTLVAWIRRDGNSSSIQYRFRQPRRKFGPVRSLPHGPGPSNLVAARGLDGTMALAWRTKGGVQVAIRAPRTGFGSPFDFAVNDFADVTDVAVGPNRDVIVTWELVGKTPRKVEVGVVRRAARVMAVQTLAIEARSPRVAFAPRGRAIVVWTQGREQTISGASRGSRGGFGEPFTVSRPGYPGQGDHHPDVTIGGNSVLSIVYLTRRRHYEGSAYQTFSNLTVATQPPGEQFRYRNLGGGLTRSASSPRIAAAANGTTTVLWGENVYAGRGEIHTSTRPPAGDYPQRSTKISTGNARTASLATATDGTAVAVWFITDKDNETRLRTASMRP